MANEEKTRQLGMPFGTANNRLRKSIIFDLLKRHKENFCFQCGAEIVTVDDMSIEHKKPWLHEGNAVELYFDLSNIAFSHLHCNIAAARYLGEPSKCGTATKYSHGCRCKECSDARREYDKKRYERGYRSPGSKIPV